tara:strand:- start:143 stop:376 length:234 start_codon:yes stop_codon:yes gene_type:complete
MFKTSKKKLRLDQKNLYKMYFIFNAILEGWTVRKINNNKFEFINKIEKCKKEIYLENYVNTFVTENLKNIEIKVFEK